MPINTISKRKSISNVTFLILHTTMMVGGNKGKSIMNFVRDVAIRI